jgi:hypothetical protein
MLLFERASNCAFKIACERCYVLAISACLSETSPSSQRRHFWLEDRFPKTKSETKKDRQPDMINIRMFLDY